MNIIIIPLKCGVCLTIWQALYDTIQKKGSKLHFSEPSEASAITAANPLYKDKNWFFKRIAFVLLLHHLMVERNWSIPILFVMKNSYWPQTMVAFINMQMTGRLWQSVKLLLWALWSVYISHKIMASDISVFIIICRICHRHSEHHAAWQAYLILGAKGLRITKPTDRMIVSPHYFQ